MTPARREIWRLLNIADDIQDRALWRYRLNLGQWCNDYNKWASEWYELAKSTGGLLIRKLAYTEGGLDAWKTWKNE